MIPYLSGRENEVDHINSLCLHLFDTWCENRSVTPLGYLLHCWPLLGSEPRALRRLGDTLRELRKSHPEALDRDVSLALRELADCVDEILAHGTVPVRITANG
ncbi:hypothetical protein [Paraburkholderia sp. SIMBA_030]|uniref:hypothetical protein n=1 Tax=Paraburkholderia sp. SIMBA_030 TaxID=3085773 RepID=UPI003979128B